MITLRKIAQFELRPSVPFNFDATVHKPSHFPAPTMAHEPGRFWSTMRFGDRLLGLRMVDIGKRDAPRIELTLFGEERLSGDFRASLVRELRWRFDLDANLAEFCQSLGDDPIVGPAIKRWAGMRFSAAHSLYEYLVITIVLQNTVVRRTVQMLSALLERYGVATRFDGRELWAFWRPEVLHATSEDQLRALKVGYRAKSLKRVSEDFLNGRCDELALRRMDRESAIRALMKIYGIGAQSVWYVLFDVLHHYDAFDTVSPWEQKIYSRLLFKQELVSAEEILSEVRRRWGRWRMLASHYLFEDLFWRHRKQPIPWLAGLIRL